MPDDPALSSFTDNDVLGLAIDKALFRCLEGGQRFIDWLVDGLLY